MSEIETTQEAGVVDDGGTDGPAGPAGTTGPRRERFEQEIARLRVATGPVASERRLLAAGVALMVGGVVVAAVAFVVSLGLADTRDVISMVVLAVFGLCLVVAGAVVFVRHSVARFLRVWLLRLLYERREPVPPDRE